MEESAGLPPMTAARSLRPEILDLHLTVKVVGFERGFGIFQIRVLRW